MIINGPPKNYERIYKYTSNHANIHQYQHVFWWNDLTIGEAVYTLPPVVYHR